MNKITCSLTLTFGKYSGCPPSPSFADTAYCTSEAGHKKVAAVLVELGGADINFQNPEGGTALIYAAKVQDTLLYAD